MQMYYKECIYNKNLLLSLYTLKDKKLVDMTYFTFVHVVIYQLHFYLMEVVETIDGLGL